MRGALTAHCCSRAAPAHDPTPRAHRHRHEYVCAQQIQSLIMSNGRPPDPHNQTRLLTSKPNDRLNSLLWHLASKDGIVLKVKKWRLQVLLFFDICNPIYCMSLTGCVQTRSGLAGVRALQNTVLPPPRGAAAAARPSAGLTPLHTAQTVIQHTYTYIQNLCWSKIFTVRNISF